MTSIDDLFRKPNVPSKRKLEPLSDPQVVYKSAKITRNGGSGNEATVEDEDDEEEGPALPPEDDGEDYGPDEDTEGRFFGGGVDEGTRNALDYVDEQDKEPFVEEKIDLSWLRKTSLNFERRISKNSELRAKFESEPQKFMGSEADLDTDIKALSSLAEHPELYEEFVKLGCAASLVSLLAHENTDIAIDAIQIIDELTDEDVQAEQTQWDALVDAMLEADLLNLITQNFQRLDESNEEDERGVYRSLSILENLASQPNTAERVGQDAGMLQWLLARIQKKESRVKQNKQYAAEILSILLQSSSANRKHVLNLDAIDIFLQLLAAYRKRDPEKDSEEEEYVENLFDALTCAVDEARGKSQFIAAEGVELCLIMLREGKMSKSRALTVLDHAASMSTSNGVRTAGGSSNGNVTSEVESDPTGVAVCTRIIEAAGLKTLFTLFIKADKSIKKAHHHTQEVISAATLNEHLLGIFASLLRTLPPDSEPRIRTLAKFVERDYEKIARLISLRREYAARVRAVDAQIEAEKKSKPAELDEDESFFRRIDAGLFVLQTLDTVLAWLVAEDDGARKAIVRLLGETNDGLGDVKRTLEEQIKGLRSRQEETELEEGVRDMLETLVGFL